MNMKKTRKKKEIIKKLEGRVNNLNETVAK